jgi:folate-binding protein YgfZ
MTTDRSASPSPAPAAPTAPLAIVRDYGDPAAEYTALRAGALLVDRSRRDRWVLRGARARETLTGLVTNDVVALAAGQGCYAAALTAKGRIVADVRVLALTGGPGAETAAADGAAAAAHAVPGLDAAVLLVDVPPRAAEGFAALLRKFVNPRVTPYARVGDQLRAFGAYGVRARDAIAAAFGAPPAALAALAPYAHATVSIDGATLLVARVPELGVDGFEVLGAPAAVDAAWARVAHAVPGVTAGGEDACTIARIEAGYPEWGIDIDDTTIPQEANLDELHAISYTKGCYTGQEVVARVHFRGHVNRHLRGLAYLADGGAIPSGAELRDETGKVVGDVRSSALSPRLGGVAIGMVRREVALGATLLARWPHPDGAAASASEGSDEGSDEGSNDAAAGAPSIERRVTVSTLPFPL